MEGWLYKHKVASERSICCLSMGAKDSSASIESVSLGVGRVIDLQGQMQT